jgi:YidC/Oxa1 family membrane protein insertase
MFGFLAQLLNWCYTLWSNYAGMVLLFTLILMVVITPFTVKGMRSAAEMSRLQPEIKKIQDQNKNDRIKQNEEMQALFKEHGVNPLGGCLPTLLPLPIFFIVFRLLERLNGHHNGAFSPTIRLLRGQVGGPGGFVAPHYLAYNSKLAQSIIAAGGQLKAFGVDLGQTALSHHTSVAQALPFYILIVVMTLSQYWQQRQINQRNPAAANANPQLKMTMTLFPIFYAFISVRIAAAVVLYLFISGVYRMGQNEISYRYDPVLKRASVPIDAGAATIDATSRPKAAVGGTKAAAVTPTKAIGSGSGKTTAKTPGKTPAKGAPTPAKQGSFMDRLRAQAAEAKAQAERAQQAKKAPSTNGAGSGNGTATPKAAPAGKAAPPGKGAPAGKSAAGRGTGQGASGGPGSGKRAPAANVEPAAGAQPADDVEPAAAGGAGRSGDAVPPAAEDLPVTVPDDGQMTVATEPFDDVAAAAAPDDAAPGGAEVGSSEDGADSVSAEVADGNGAPAPPRSSSSPLSVTRPSGRVSPKGQSGQGRRPRRGQ